MEVDHRPLMTKRRKIHGQPSSVVELPSDVIFSHILPRLPPKTLMRFKLVCKDWFSRIRSSSFASAYSKFCCNNNNSTGTTNLILMSRNLSDLFSSQIDQLQQGIKPTLPADHLILMHVDLHTPKLQSVNGLICISPSSRWPDSPAFILNPTTREFTKLPQLTFPADNKDKLVIRHRKYLFGFTPLTNQYKVLQIVLFLNKEKKRWDKVTFHVFTVGDEQQSWRTLHVDATTNPTLHRRDYWVYQEPTAMCLHGAIHEIKSSQKHIMVFDVAEETFGSIPIPASIYTANGVVSMVEVEGCVGLFAYKFCGEIVLWILEDYKNHETWVEKTIKPYPPTRTNYKHAVALFTIHTGELAIVLHRRSHDLPLKQPELHLYDMKIGLYRQLEFDVPAYDSNIEVVTSYVDSIVPVK